MKKFVLGVLSLVVLGLLAGCAASNSKSEQAKSDKEQLSIVTTFFPIYDFTRNIVGDAGEVTLLVPAGSEPHDYEPSAKKMAQISDADVFVYHNDEMEGWVQKAKKSWDKGSPNVLEGTKEMVLLPGSDDGHEHHHDDGEHEEEGHVHALDPHTWVSPNMAIKEVTNIKNQLVSLYPAKAELFEANTKKYLKELKKLDDEYTAELKNAQQKSIVTQHAAFGYLALDYGLNQVAIAGLTPEQEPSPSRLAELKEYVAENDIQYIYFEKNASDKIARTLASEANVKLAVLNPLESLTQDQMDKGENYLSVMKDNLKALKKTTAVKGKAVVPEKAEETTKTVAAGYFSDSAVEKRQLSDYEGNWQSVYPLLKDGTLDSVFEYKAKLSQTMTATEYKAYYELGYKTDVSKIKIADNTITFDVDGTQHKYTYKNAGYEVLTYEKGNRGVRFQFETDDPEAGRFKYVQFSDHNIAPVKAEHFHIYFGGDSQAQLHKELENWPTYYPNDLSKHEIAQEMIAH